MRPILIVILFLFSIFNNSLLAQVEKVIVEKYYISDSLDATDNTGGLLVKGSTTYRIYVDLKPGCKLKKIYGDVNHALIFNSDSTFFNNGDRGQTFGKDFSKNHLSENTVGVDSWITLGQVTKNFLGKTHFGILKSQDTDGSFVGGTNNDGGSSAIVSGLLNNNNSVAGIPLTTADGIDTMVNIPSGWANYGILDIVTGADSTIFGSEKKGNHFYSRNAGLQNNGTKGVVPDSNQILVAQLTTKGALAFSLNVELEEFDGVNINTVKYVANDSVLLPGEKLNRFLNYPYIQVCGCPDPNYLEYAPTRDCDITDSCKTRIVFGCMDTSACNYDKNANFNLQSLCCYPGYCNDRNIAVVCPSVSNFNEVKFYPNPAQNQLTIEIAGVDNQLINYTIYDSFGTIKLNQDLGLFSGNFIKQVDVSSLNPGLYLILLSVGNQIEKKQFLKN